MSFVFFLLAFVSADPRAAQVTTPGVVLEYIGHASFVIESPAGVRLVVDPFSSIRWLGYRYPHDVVASAVLVTHPHYDHDASYYWGDSVPVFRGPGRYRLGDVEIHGVEGKHADPYGKDFDQKNTIWIVEVGGLRIAHLGDNGPLDDALARELGRVDVLLIPIDADEHILKREEVQATRQRLGDPLVVPMHFRLDGFLGLPRSLGSIDPWLESEAGVVRWESNRVRIDSTRDPKRRVLLLRPSPDLRPWRPELAKAWEDFDEARQIEANYPTELSAATALIEKAYESAGTIVFSFHWAEALSRSGKENDAVRILEESLSRADEEDWEYRMRARSLLAGLYAGSGRPELAAAQYRVVLRDSYRPALREPAARFLENFRSR
jgi:L-ascorbate metabolism protein UlaG (beta-lactamase superfamily)